MPDLTAVLTLLRQERNRIDKAILALHGLTTNNPQHNGNRAAKRTMSADARKRIAAAQKARWAKWRKQQRKAA